MVSQHITTLDNGLKVVAIEQPHLHAAAIALAVRCGSRHEAASEWGLSHLLEHMLFRGSGRHRSAAALAQAFEGVGGTIEAATWRDHTGLSVSVDPGALPDAMAALGDMAARPRFLELERERGIVGAEIDAEVDGRGRDLAADNVARAAVWGRHPMARRIIGSRRSVAAFDRAALRAHHARHYCGRNAVLCVAGPLAARRATALARRSFARLPAGAARDDGPAARFAPAAQITWARRAAAQVSLHLTFAALGERDPDFAAARLLASVLDDGLSSRLQQAVCADRGLAYHLEAGLDAYADCGLFEVACDLAPAAVPDALAAILDVLADVCRAAPTPAEVAGARRRHLHALACRGDAPAELAGDLAAAHLFGGPDATDEDAAALRRVRRPHLLRVARQIFRGAPPHLTLAGPITGIPRRRVAGLLDAFARGP